MLEPAQNPWQLVDRRTVYTNPWTELIEDRLAGPDGRPGLYGYLADCDYAMVCAVDQREHVLLVRQWRWAFGVSSWELPCGRLETGEDPQTAAVRELAEETGHRAATWRGLGSFHASDARVAGRGHAFLATDLERVEAPAPETSEVDLLSRAVPLDTALAAVEDGRISNVASLYVLLRAARHLGR
jgi:8-oxo-dGTP pyrophosphatase MutT (NUDIX family)